jgi:chemotaxis protein methyltransferase CheR
VSADADCVAFLQWALPRLGRRWAGYRKVRRQVCRRVRRRAGELGLASLARYRERLERDPDEWSELDALLNVTISRFCRDRGVFAVLQSELLPALAGSARDGVVRAWSAGCASGEEPYTLAIIWELAIAPDAQLRILATDTDPALLRRAAAGRYPPSSLRELPGAWRDAAFARDGDDFVLASRFRRDVTFARRDIRDPAPGGPFDLVLCRNLAFTYFDDAGQRATVRRLAGATRPGAALVLGTHERLPDGEPGFEPWAPQVGVFRRAGAAIGGSVTGTDSDGV